MAARRGRRPERADTVPVLIAALVLLAVLAAVPVAAVLGLTTIGLDLLYADGRLQRTFGSFLWDTSSSFALVAIPLFVLLGEIVLRSGIAAQMYAAVAKWLGWLPGGLMHANIGCSAIFAATSGSSVATAATIGTVAYPEIERHGYRESVFLGSVAAGGTLGILIPPSVPLIVYGVMTQTSILELYLAGLIPGIAMAVMFGLTILALSVLGNRVDGERVRTGWVEKLAGLRHIVPPVVLFLGVVGSIYAGFATPTEAASIGVILALAMAATRGTLTLRMLRDAFEGTIRTTAMIVLIVLAAMLLNIVIGFLGVIQAASSWVSGLGLTPVETMLVIVAFYLVLGLFMETFAMLVTTIGIVFPIVTALGFDPVWFGVVLILLMETALITPPIGLNLFVVQGVRARGGAFRDVCAGALPFVLAMVVMILLLIAFPQIALWAPAQFY
jgi:tripartite ATP-independent transporter DctM subunit